MFLNRLIRAIQLDPGVFLEVAKDKSSLAPALAIALLSNIGASVGSVGGHVEKIPLAIATAFAGWIFWAVSIYIIGAKFFPLRRPESTRLRSILCITGFASAPGFIRFLAYFPPFSVIVTLGATIWMFATTLIATKQVLGYQGMPRTIGVIFFGWVVYQWLLITI